MHRITRGLAALTLAAAAMSVTACATDSGESASEPATGVSETTSEMTTTSSAPVPAVDDQPVELPTPVVDRWNQLGGPESGLGLVTGPATDVEGGAVADFERGSIVMTPEGDAFVVQGEILGAYREAGGPEGELGFPTSDETTTDGGWISTFENGAITAINGETSVESK